MDIKKKISRIWVGETQLTHWFSLIRRWSTVSCESRSFTKSNPGNLLFNIRTSINILCNESFHGFKKIGVSLSITIEFRSYLMNEYLPFSHLMLTTTGTNSKIQIQIILFYIELKTMKHWLQAIFDGKYIKYHTTIDNKINLKHYTYYIDILDHPMLLTLF